MSLEKLTMPQLGESVTEGTITSWLVKPGDFINKYDPVAEVLTDKVTAEIPSSFSGTIEAILVEEDETVQVGAEICSISTNEQEKQEVTAQPEVAKEKVEKKLTEESGEDQSMQQRYSPAVLKLAQENSIDLSTLNGSGRSGRITRKDVENFIASGEANNEVRHEEKAPKEKMQINNSKEEYLFMQDGSIEVPVSGIRKAVAEKMVRSKQEIPHAWMKVEADVTNLVKFRNQEKEQFKEKEGYPLTYFAFFVKAVAQALREFPELNSTWAGDKIIQHKRVNISIAVAAQGQLFVPVIKDADDLSIKGIASKIAAFIKKANEGKLTVEDMSGGTFTVNNTGTFGSIESMGIINHPQAAILQVESIVKRPVIIDDMFAARDMVNLCLSLDHRILDGLVCGQFLASIKDSLENISNESITIY